MPLFRSILRYLASTKFKGALKPVESLRRPVRKALETKIDLDRLVGPTNLPSHRESKKGLYVQRKLSDELNEAKRSKSVDLIRKTLHEALRYSYLTTSNLNKCVDLCWFLLDLGENLNEADLLSFSEGLAGRDLDSKLPALRMRNLEDLDLLRLGQLTRSISPVRNKDLDEKVLHSHCMSKLEAIVRPGINSKSSSGLDLAEKSLRSLSEILRPVEDIRDSKVKLSVGMPAFNSEDFIGDAIESVLQQSHANLELIVVDDCSSDSTASIAEKYAAQDTRVKVIKNRKNIGAYASRNIALAEASGELFTTHDSDDHSLSHKFKIQINDLMESQKFGNHTFYVKFGRRGLTRLPFTAGRFVAPNLSSLMFHRQEAIGNVGFWFEGNVAMDSEYFDRVKETYGDSLYGLPRIDTLVRIRDSSLTANPYTGGRTAVGRLYRETILRIWREWWEKHPESRYEPSLGGPPPIPILGENSGLPAQHLSLNETQRITKKHISDHLSGIRQIVLVKR